MNCPRHNTELKAQSHNGHQLDQCPECSGVWIQGEVIDQVLGPGERLKLRSLCSVHESKLLCPADGRTLHEGKVGPVTVDLCQTCNGLWLDPGELAVLGKRKPLAPHVPSESSVPLADLARADSSIAEEVVLLSLLSLW